MLSPTTRRSLNTHGRALHLCLRCQRGHRPLPRSSALSFSTSTNHAADAGSDFLTTLSGSKTRDRAPDNANARGDADLRDRTFRPRRRVDERSQSPSNAMRRDTGASSSRTGNSSQSRSQHQGRSTSSNSNTNWSKKAKEHPSTETPPQSYDNEPLHPSTRTAVIKFWEPLQNIADAWAVRKYLEERYGTIIETHFLKDFEMPTTYQLTAYIVFASPKSLELIANEQTSLTSPTPGTGTGTPPPSPKTHSDQKPKVKLKSIDFMVPAPSSANGKALCEIGMEDLEGLIGSGDDLGVRLNPRGAQDATKQVQMETKGRVIGGTLGVADAEFNNDPRDKRIFQLTSLRNMEAFLKWGGFVPLPALKPVVAPEPSSASVKGKTDSTGASNHPNPLAATRNGDADEPRIEPAKGPLKLTFTDGELFPIHASMSTPRPALAASTSTLASISTSAPPSTSPTTAPHIETREARRMRTALEMCALVLGEAMPEGVRPGVVRAGEEGEKSKSEDGKVKEGESAEAVEMHEKEKKQAGREFAGLYEEGVSPEPLGRLRGTSLPDSEGWDSLDSAPPASSSTSNPAQPPQLTPEQIAESQELARQMNAARMLSRIRGASVSAAAAANAKARKPRVPVVVESAHGKGKRDSERSNHESEGEGEEGGKEEKRGLLGLIRSMFGR